MKLRNIFTALAAAAIAFVGCQVEERFLDEVQVSQSIVAIPVDGGQVEVTVTANDAWEIAGAPEWLTVSPASGAAGETVVTFSAEATTETREGMFYINVGEVQQVMNALQMAEKVETPLSTCKDVINGVDGKIYKIKGTVTSIVNTQYGNWYIQDDTGSVYVYGTLYNGATQQFTKLGLEVGDIVTIEGPRKDYNGTIEMIDVTVLDIEKSLIKLEKVLPAEPLSLDGGVATALLTVKEGDVEVVIPEDATWLTAGEPTALGSMVSVDLTAAPNEGGARKTTVTFKVNVNDKDYIAMADIEQLGAIKAVTVEEFLAEAEGTALYELTGIVKNIANTTYGNFDLVDATGSVYVYGLTNNGAIGSNDKKFAELGINEGDVVTIVGTRAAYKGSPQVGGTAYLVEHVVAASVSTVADFLAQPVAADKWFKLTGKVANMKSDVYGNFDLVDETGSVYVYGLTTAKVAKNDKSFANTGVKEGDIVTLVGTRSAYNGQDQVGGPAYYISHEEGAPAVDPWETAAVFVNGEDATDDTRLKELRAYADTDFLYVRLTATKETPFGANYFDFHFTDGEGDKEVRWMWTTKGTDIYYQEHKCEINESGELTKMRWYPVEGDRVYIDDYTTKSTDTEVRWEMKFPRSYVDVYKSSTGKTYLSFILWNGWDGYWVIPARGNAMLEVTLP